MEDTDVPIESGHRSEALKPNDSKEVDVGRLIVDNIQKDVTVGRVLIEGIKHTNFEFLNELTRDLLNAKNVGDVIIGSRNVGAKLKKLQIFKSVEVEVRADPNYNNTVEIVYKVEESPRIYASTGADFGASDASMVIKLIEHVD